MKCNTCGNESQTGECISCMIESAYKQHGLGSITEAISKSIEDNEEKYALATEALSKSFEDNEKKYGLATEALLKTFKDNEKIYGLGLGSIPENLYSNKSNIQKESSLDIELIKTKNEIVKLKKELEKSNQNEEEVKITNEKLKEFEKKYENLNKDMEKLKSNEEKVEETIDFIKKLPENHLSELKSTIEHRIKVFNRIGFWSLFISGVTFLGYFCSLLLNLPTPTTAVSYFNNVFFIVFPTIVAFTSYRQSNLKSEELEKINEKLLNSNYLVASLQAIQKISKESDRDDNVLVSINKLIDSILHKKDEKKVSDDLDINEVKTILRDVALMMKTFQK